MTLRSSILFCSFLFPGVMQATDTPVYDVRLFGAIGDGRTDDQMALQAASDAASKVPGAIVHVPRGIYLHSGVVDFSSNILEGAGSESVLIASSAAAAAIRFADAGNCAIRHIKVSSPVSKRLLNDEAAAILLANSHDCSISEVSIDGAAGPGINIHGSSDIVVDNVDVRNTRADGIHVVSGSHRVTVSNSSAYDTGDDSFSAIAYDDQEQTRFVIFRNNVSYRSKARGVTCIGADDCIIEHNRIFSPAAHGIAVAWESSYHTWHPHRARIENNSVRDAATPGMNPLLVDQATDVDIGFNEVEASNPIYLHGSANILLHHTHLTDAGTTAVIARDCRSLSVTDNTISGARYSGLVLERVHNGSISRNILRNVELEGEPGKAAIDVVDSSDLTGSGNVVRHSNAWRGKTFGPIRVVSSPGVSIVVEVEP